MAEGRRHIIIVEDDQNLAAGIVENLLAEGFSVDHLSDGHTLLDVVEKKRPDLLVLDVMLPGQDGIRVCGEIRQAGHQVPVLFLTARGDPKDRLNGFAAGGDDYLTKPFNLQELLYRVKAILKRTAPEKTSSTPKEIVFGDNRICLKTYTAQSWNGEEHDLTQKEIAILKVLWGRPNEVISREDLLDGAWGMEVFPSTRTIDNFILRLRKRFELEPDNPQHFLTVHGVGYRFIPDKRSVS